jgi:hypothetical protein
MPGRIEGRLACRDNAHAYPNYLPTFCDGMKRTGSNLGRQERFLRQEDIAQETQAGRPPRHHWISYTPTNEINLLTKFLYSSISSPTIPNQLNRPNGS